MISLYPDLIHKVVDPSQSFEPGAYTGKFEFNFYQYGKWVTVTIDDRLPTRHGKLIFSKSDDSQEFWSALLEKAYAKLNGSYENLKGGISTEAMVDLTGGVVEYFEKKNMEENNSRDNYRKIRKGYKNGAIMTCAIQASGYEVENKRSDGLLKGHAYTIISAHRVKNKVTRERYRLLKLRNPWGQVEFTGQFSDVDDIWENINRDLRDDDADNGEFCIEWEFFTQTFTKLEFCRLDMGKVDNIQGVYEEVNLEGSWNHEKYNSAGGCVIHDSYFNNPFIIIEILGGEESDQMLISLSQKHRRKLKSEGIPMLDIGFEVYLVKDEGMLEEYGIGTEGFLSWLLTGAVDRNA